MSWYSEFRSSLKSYDVEEILDIYFFRPISFLFVKMIYSTNITPNQISIFSMLFGLLSGVFFAFGTPFYFMLAGIMLLISNVLDCADGQLARLKNNGTGIGRIIDGFIDYITGFAIFTGMGIGLTIYTGEVLYVWILILAGALSRILQNMWFDNYRNSYLLYVYNKGENIEKEIEEYRRMKHILDRQKGRHLEKFLVNIYIKYSSVQKNATHDKRMKITSGDYKLKNKSLLRLWSWIGSTTHLSAVIVLSVINRLDLYLWFTITAGNIILISLYFYQKKVLKDLIKNN